MSRGQERRAVEAHVALIFDDWDEEERAMMVDLMCDDEANEAEEESDVPAAPVVAGPPAVLTKEVAQQIADEMTAALARVRSAAEVDR